MISVLSKYRHIQNKRYRLYLSVVFLMLFSSISAQRIEIVDFIKNYVADEFDAEDVNEIALRENNKCALLFVDTPNALDFNANLGIRRQYKSKNIQLLLLPRGTSRIQLSHNDYSTLYYTFPEQLEANVKYKMTVSFPNNKEPEKIVIPQIPQQRPSYSKSTDIELSEFRINPKSLIGSFSPVYDNTGQACAVFRYLVNSEGFVIEPNLGVVKSIEKPGEIIQYVPVGTRRLTIKNGNFMPIRDYEIPVEIAAKATYDVTLSLTYNAVRRQKASPDHDNYLGIGYNLPELSFDADGGKRSFTIHCNGTWDISAPSWCKLSKMSGSGVMEIEVSVKGNLSGNPRRGVIGIQSQGITVTINVEQK